MQILAKSIEIQGKIYDFPIEVIFNNGRRGLVIEGSTAINPFKTIRIDNRILLITNNCCEWAVKKYLI